MADQTTSTNERSDPQHAQGEARRTLNKTVAQRQKLLLAGIGGIALLGGAMFIFSGDDQAEGDGNGPTEIDTGGLVNRNLSSREFVATYGNRLDAQGRAIKDLQESQFPKTAIEQELETLRGENARMLGDGQAAIDAISAENAALRGELETVRANPPIAPAVPGDPGTAGTPSRTDRASGGSESQHTHLRERRRKAGARKVSQRSAAAAPRSEPRLPAAQQLCTRHRHRRGRCLDRSDQPERSAPRGAAHNRPGTLGDEGQSPAHHRHHRLPR